MGFDLLGFGNNFGINPFGLPEIGIDEIPALPKIEIPDPVIIKDTFTSEEVATLPPPPVPVEAATLAKPEQEPSTAPPQTPPPKIEDTFTTASPSIFFDPNTNPFTTPINYYDLDVKFSGVEFDPNAFKFDPNAFKDSTLIDLAWIDSTASKLNFTDVYKIDRFKAKDPNQLTFEEMKSATTELNARLEFLNDSQKRTLSALTQDISNIETIASRNKVTPDQVLQDLLKKEPEKYANYSKFINAAKEQVTAGEVAKFAGDNKVRQGLIKENKTIQEFIELSTKLKANQYTSPDEKAQDLFKLVKLQSEIEKSVDFHSEEVKNINTEAKNMLVKQMQENKALIQASLDELPAAYDKRIKELRGKQDLSQEEQATLKRYENNREKVLKLVEKAKNSGFDKFAESYSALIMEIQKTDPERAQELITGIVKGKIAPEIFAESVKKTGDTEDREAATGILHDIYTDRDLANKLQVTSKDKDSQIRRNGGLDSWAKDLNLSQPNYNSSYTNQEQALTSSAYPNPDEISLSTKLDQSIARGELASVASLNAAVRKLMLETGISEVAAKLVLLGDREELLQYMQQTSNSAPKYLALAELSNLNNT